MQQQARFYSADEFCKLFQPPKNKQSVERLMRENKIPVRKVGGSRYIDMDEFNRSTGNDLADSLLD